MPIDVKHYSGNRPILDISDPDLVKSILVTDFHVFSQRSDNRDAVQYVQSMLMLFHNQPNWRTVRSMYAPMYST
ncbi:unnamed protein product, partial [Oppiella nova]